MAHESTTHKVKMYALRIDVPAAGTAVRLSVAAAAANYPTTAKFIRIWAAGSNGGADGGIVWGPSNAIFSSATRVGNYVAISDFETLGAPQSDAIGQRGVGILPEYDLSALYVDVGTNGNDVILYWEKY